MTKPGSPTIVAPAPAAVRRSLVLILAGFTPACAAGEGDEAGLSTFGNTGPQPTTFTTLPADSGDDPTDEDSEDDAGDGDPGDGDGDPPTCGNGQLDPGETCDGFELDGESCATLGYTGGALACTDDCQDFDVSGCENDLCGNGIIDAGELCDGPELQGQTCQSVGFAGGQLACGPSCLTFDTSGCVEAQCGNGVIEAGEVCDGNALGGQTCQTQGFLGGTLQCNVNCASFNTSLCSNGDGDCCLVHFYAGCQDPGITNCVCAFDSYCCTNEWDMYCVQEAISDCGAIC